MQIEHTILAPQEPAENLEARTWMEKRKILNKVQSCVHAAGKH